MNFTEMDDIKIFDNGLDVDKTVDEMKEKNDPKIIQGFMKDAFNAEFLVPYKDGKNNLCVYNTKDKEQMLPIFSCYEAFLKSPIDHEKAIIMKFSQINSIITQSVGALSGILVNPHGKSLTLRHNAEKNEVKLSRPASVPTAVTAALCGFFSASENVYKAYLLWAQKENELAPHLLLIVDFDGGKEDFFPKIAEAIRPFISGREKIEMAKADMKLLSTAEKIDKPFYKK